MGNLSRSILFSALSLMLLPLLWDAPAIAQTKDSDRPTTWRRIQRLFGQREHKGGAKGAFCPLAPSAFGHDGGVVWSRSPLVAWRGELERVEVRSGDEASLLWQWQGPQAARERGWISFEGEPLQPGETYSLWMFLPGSGAATSPSLRMTFSVLPEAERQVTDRKLERLTRHYERFGLAGEQLARYRVGFFAERELWSDALREMMAFEAESPELRQALVGLEGDLCDGKSEVAPTVSPLN